MGKLQKKVAKVLDCFSPSSCGSNSCFCINSMEDQEDEFDKEPLMPTEKDDHLLTLKDVVNGNQTLAFQLKPKVLLFLPIKFEIELFGYKFFFWIFVLIFQMVTLRVSMHCRGCARKVEKHISKMEGRKNYSMKSSQ